MNISNDLALCLSRRIRLSDDLAELLLSSALVKIFPKGTVLLRQGDIATENYFILKGCVRSYTIKDGNDKTINFFMEEDPVLPIGYGKNEPSIHFLECLEDTVTVVNSPEQEERRLPRNGGVYGRETAVGLRGL